MSRNDRRIPAWLELQFAVQAAIAVQDPAPPKSLIYHAQRAQPLIRNVCKSDEERVIAATLNAMRELTLAWVECEAESKPAYRAAVTATYQMLQIWRADIVAELVARIDEARAERQREFNELRHGKRSA